MLLRGKFKQLQILSSPNLMVAKVCQKEQLQLYSQLKLYYF